MSLGAHPPACSPLHLFYQIQKRLLELSSHCVCLVEPGDGAALAQALRGSLWGVAGEEVCHHLSRGGQQAGAVVEAPRHRETPGVGAERQKGRNRGGEVGERS